MIMRRSRPPALVHRLRIWRIASARPTKTASPIKKWRCSVRRPAENRDAAGGVIVEPVAGVDFEPCPGVGDGFFQPREFALGEIFSPIRPHGTRRRCEARPRAP